MSNTIKIISVVAGCALLLSMLVYLAVFLVQSQTIITDVTPDITTDNSILTIYGTHFGKERGTGSIEINNQLIPPSSYVLWSNSAVRIIPPDTFTSGVIELITHRGNVAMYIISHFDFIPIATEQSSGVRMNIESVTPQGALSVGDVLTLRGTFLNHEDIEIFLPHNIRATNEEGVIAEARTINQQLTPSNGSNVSLLKIPDRSYIKKNSTEIVLRIPTGATSGTIIVRDSFNGEWRGMIEIDDSVGTQQYYRPVVYNLQFLLDIPATLGGDYQLHSLPSDLSGQSVTNLLFSNHSHQLFGFGELGYYQLAPTDIADSLDVDNRVVRFTLQAKRYTIATTITNPTAIDRQAAVSNHYASNIATNKQHLQSILVPDAIPSFTSVSYMLRIRDIYDYVLRVLEPDTESAVDVFVQSQSTADIALATLNKTLSALSSADDIQQNPVAANALQYAWLMFYLLNLNNIPVQLTVGLLFEEDATRNAIQHPVSASLQSVTSINIVPHYWVLCYLPSIGWVPIDSALGDEMYQRDAIETPQNHYFGNLDNQRIAIEQLSTLQKNSARLSALHLYQSVQQLHNIDDIASVDNIDSDDKSYDTRIALFARYE